MVNVRIIPRLDIKGPNLVKGVHLEGLRVLGKPESFARYYYEQGADELMYMDVVASLYERNSLQDIITRTAREIFIPLTVGGGIRSIEDINRVLRAGADKVSINTAAIRDPELIRRAAHKFGSSTIVVAIEAIRQPDGRYLAFTDNGREHTGIDALEWAERVEALGAGEIVATSVDREGTGEGFDLEYVRQIAQRVSIPVIAHGGAGQMNHVAKVIQQGKADAVAVASILHYDYIQRSADSGHTDEEGNVEFLKTGRRFSTISPCRLDELKEFLNEAGIACRRDAPHQHVVI
jgi:cyclase